MLTSLHIENIAVIRCADLDLSSGFSALTGETGAGKSMIVDSINLLLGNRTSRELIRSGETSASVSAVFEQLPQNVVAHITDMGFAIEDASLMLSRTITLDGKSQTRINGRVITQAMQKEIARLLISIQGQADSQTLLQKSKHRDRKTHVFRKCPACKSVLRLPRQKGKHTVRCPRCQHRFDVKI